MSAERTKISEPTPAQEGISGSGSSDGSGRLNWPSCVHVTDDHVLVPGGEMYDDRPTEQRLCKYSRDGVLLSVTNPRTGEKIKDHPGIGLVSFGVRERFGSKTK